MALIADLERKLEDQEHLTEQQRLMLLRQLDDAKARKAAKVSCTFCAFCLVLSVLCKDRWICSCKNRWICRSIYLSWLYMRVYGSM
jgi:hypothetical protein